MELIWPVIVRTLDLHSVSALGNFFTIVESYSRLLYSVSLFHTSTMLMDYDSYPPEDSEAARAPDGGAMAERKETDGNRGATIEA